jgi:hypothetical protein
MSNAAPLGVDKKCCIMLQSLRKSAFRSVACAPLAPLFQNFPIRESLFFENEMLRKSGASGASGAAKGGK